MEVALQINHEDCLEKGYEIPNRVFVGGLCQETSELELENFFSDYGSVLDVRIVCDRKTGKNKGFGFVTFHNESISRDLIEKGSIEYKGHRIRLRRAVRRVLGGQYMQTPSGQTQIVSTQSLQWPHILDSGPQMLYPYGIPFNQPVENNMYYYNTCMMPPYTPAPALPPMPPAQYIISYY